MRKNVYAEHQEMAECEIITKLNELLSTAFFLTKLKQWSMRCACRFVEYREITVCMKSGKRWKVLSPVFLRAKPKRKCGRPPKRRKGVLRHLGLEILGIIKQASPALIETCVSMAVLCLHSKLPPMLCVGWYHHEWASSAKYHYALCHIG